MPWRCPRTRAALAPRRGSPTLAHLRKVLSSTSFVPRPPIAQTGVWGSRWRVPGRVRWPATPDAAQKGGAQTKYIRDAFSA
jgi:hypothetical protein